MIDTLGFDKVPFPLQNWLAGKPAQFTPGRGFQGMHNNNAGVAAAILRQCPPLGDDITSGLTDITFGLHRRRPPLRSDDGNVQATPGPSQDVSMGERESSQPLPGTPQSVVSSQISAKRPGMNEDEGAATSLTGTPNKKPKGERQEDLTPGADTPNYSRPPETT